MNFSVKIRYGILLISSLVLWSFSNAGAEGNWPYYTVYPDLDPTGLNKSYIDGLVVRVYRVHRNEGITMDIWGDWDWNLTLRPTQCVGNKFGRDCNAERERFLQIFWDSGEPRCWKPAVSNKLKAVKKTCGLSGADARALWNSAMETAVKFNCFSTTSYNDSSLGAACTPFGSAWPGNDEGDNLLVEAEVQVQNHTKDVERSSIGRYLDEMNLADCTEGATSGVKLCGQDVLIFGLYVRDNGHLAGRPEIHPVHGLVTIESQTYTSATAKIRIFADYGKASGHGKFTPTGKISEWWPFYHKAQAYLEVDPNFLMKFEDIFPLGNRPGSRDYLLGKGCTLASPWPVYDKGRLELSPNPSSDNCPTVRYFAEFTTPGDNPIDNVPPDDDNTTNLARGLLCPPLITPHDWCKTLYFYEPAGQGQFVKPGFALVNVDATRNIETVTHTITAMKNPNPIPAGNLTGAPNAPTDSYYRIDAQSNSNSTFSSLNWCLPPDAFIPGQAANLTSPGGAKCKTFQGGQVLTFYVPMQSRPLGVGVLQGLHGWGQVILIGATGIYKGEPVEAEKVPITLQHVDGKPPLYPIPKPSFHSIMPDPN